MIFLYRVLMPRGRNKDFPHRAEGKTTPQLPFAPRGAPVRVADAGPRVAGLSVTRHGRGGPAAPSRTEVSL